jgi:hypothetical protein
MPSLFALKKKMASEVLLWQQPITGNFLRFFFYFKLKYSKKVFAKQTSCKLSTSASCELKAFD